MNRTVLIAVCVLLAAAIFFRFALVGYSFTAYALAFIAAVVLLYGVLLHLRLRGLVIALSVALALLLIAVAALEALVLGSAHTDRAERLDYVIVLGAGVNGSVPSLSMKNRCDAAFECLSEHPEATAILSGAQGPDEDLSEAEAMFIYLKDLGVEPERMILEDKSTSTRQNLENSFEIITERGGSIRERTAVVSSEYHLYRAKRIASLLGGRVLGVAARTTKPVLRWNYYLRESFAVAYSLIFGL